MQEASTKKGINVSPCAQIGQEEISFSGAKGNLDQKNLLTQEIVNTATHYLEK